LIWQKELLVMLIREAKPDDNEELINLQAKCPQGTTLIVSAVNTPDFFARSNVYEDSMIYVALEENQIIASAACAVRNATLDNRIKKIGYEFQAFVDPGHRGKRIAGQLHRIREEYLRKQGAALSYSLIMEGNDPSIRHLVRQGFKWHKTIVMPSIPVFKEMNVRSDKTIRPIVPEDISNVVSLLNSTWKGYELYEPMTTVTLDHLLVGTPAYSFDNLLVLEDSGDIVACLGLWDWSRVMQITVEALSTKMRMMNLFLDIMRLFRPLPQGPRPGDILKQAVLTPIGFKDPKLLTMLLPYINNLALTKGIQQIFFLADRNHALHSLLKGFIHIDTDMHLYIKPLSIDLLLGDGPVYINGLDM
jgi:GNAT superfamily N-acetyltransferase